MLLAIDIGNTQITLGIFKDDKLILTSRLASETKKTSDQYAVDLYNIFLIHNIDYKKFSGIIISSVVPELTLYLNDAVVTVTGVEPCLIHNDIDAGLDIVDEAKGHVGADLAAVSVAAKEEYPLPCFIIDLGTATKIILLNENGKFMGCTISPGVRISLETLFAKASLLPSISLKAPEKSIGTNSVDCMKAGTVFGTASMIDGLTDRMEKEFGSKIKSTVATGGYAEEIIKCCNREMIYDKDLILYGLKKIYERKNCNEKK